VNLWTVIDKHRPPTRTEAEKQRFSEYVRAVQNPGALLDDLEQGRVSPEVLETWEALYPEELEDVRKMVMGEVNRKLSGGHVFDELEVRRLNKLMGHSDDAYTAAMQNNYEQAEPQSAPAGQPGAPVNISKQMSTRFDQAREGRY
jgi:hypothetical protein